MDERATRKSHCGAKGALRLEGAYAWRTQATLHLNGDDEKHLNFQPQGSISRLIAAHWNMVGKTGFEE